MNHNDVADYLAQHPDFFVEHAELLASIKLTSPLLGKAISLQERQMEIVREKYKALELRLGELMRIAEANDTISVRFQQWTRSLLIARNDIELPHMLTHGLRDIFDLPHATLRVWGVAADYDHTWFAQPVSEDVKLFAKGLTQPYCGANLDFEASHWIEDESAAQSIAMLPLRIEHETFGLLVLGSPDPARYTEDMATDFLTRIADTSSAALYHMLG